MKNHVMLLSKEIALLYLANEFFKCPIKGLFWMKMIAGQEVILESDVNFLNLEINDFEYLKNIYEKGN